MRRALFIGFLTLLLPLAGGVVATVAVPAQVAYANTTGTNIPTVKGGSDQTSFIGSMLLYILQMFAWWVGAMGIFMGIVIKYTIVEAGTYINSLGSIQTAWEVFRDLGNIVLVFGFIAIGIATILDNASYGAKKALPMFLIVAVMLNFSLFAAEFVVDTSNMFATQFYTQINGGNYPSSLHLSNEPISNIIMNKLKLTSIYNIDNNTGTAAKTAGSLGTKNPQNHWFITFMLGIVLFIITAFVLGTIAIMLLTRFIILVFLLIVSPFGFIGFAGIPLLDKYGKKWWSALTDQALLAPVLMLLLLVALKLIQSATFLYSANTTYAGATQSSVAAATDSIAQLLLGFSIIIGLLLATIIISKTLSGKAAGFATKWAGRATVGAFVGGLAFTGRHTIGRSAHAGYERVRKSNWATAHPFMGRMVSGGLSGIAASSFDARGTKTLQAAAGAGGVPLDKPNRGGFTASQKAWTEKREKYATKAGEATIAEREKISANERKIKESTDAKEIENLIAENREIGERMKNRTRAAAENLSGFYSSRVARQNILANLDKSSEQRQVDALMGMLKKAGAEGKTEGETNTKK